MGAFEKPPTPPAIPMPPPAAQPATMANPAVQGSAAQARARAAAANGGTNPTGPQGLKPPTVAKTMLGA